jgi:hypothetical protein
MVLGERPKTTVNVKDKNQDKINGSVVKPISQTATKLMIGFGVYG